MSAAAPMCRICGSAHWARDPHRWGVSKNPDKPAPVSKKTDKPFSVPCACGCGRPIEVKPKYATDACRKRVARSKK